MQISYLKPTISFALKMKIFMFVVSIMDLAKTQRTQESNTDLYYWGWPVCNSLLQWNWSQIRPQCAGIHPSFPPNFLLPQSLLHPLSPLMLAFPALRWCQVTGRSETGVRSLHVTVSLGQQLRVVVKLWRVKDPGLISSFLSAEGSSVPRLLLPPPCLK